MTIPGKQRDTRLDVLRALALLMIFIDHVPGQPLEHWTLRNFGFSDASEIFVLISGMAVALAYGRKYDLHNLKDLSVKAWRRALTLFNAHLTGTFVTLAIFIVFAWAFARPELTHEIEIGPVLAEPLKGILALTTLGHQLGYNNILPMYMVLMLLVPVIIYLERKSPLALILLSGAIWALAGTLRIGPPRMLQPGIWFFNPLSWQFLFVIGYVGMRQVAKGKKVGGNPILFALSLLYVFFACVWIVDKLGAYSSLRFDLPFVLTGSDKTYLTGWRLLHVLSVTYVFISLPQLSNLARLPYGNPLSVIGRHGLTIFLIGTILAVLAQAIMKVSGSSALLGLALIAIGIQIQIAAAYIFERRDSKAMREKAAPQVPAFPQGAIISPVPEDLSISTR